jgi:hypothetical protein
MVSAISANLPSIKIYVYLFTMKAKKKGQIKKQQKVQELRTKTNGNQKSNLKSLLICNQPINRKPTLKDFRFTSLFYFLSNIKTISPGYFSVMAILYVVFCYLP